MKKDPLAEMIKNSSVFPIDYDYEKEAKEIKEWGKGVTDFAYYSPWEDIFFRLDSLIDNVRNEYENLRAHLEGEFADTVDIHEDNEYFAALGDRLRGLVDARDRLEPVRYDAISISEQNYNLVKAYRMLSEDESQAMPDVTEDYASLHYQYKEDGCSFPEEERAALAAWDKHYVDIVRKDIDEALSCIIP